MIVKTNDLVSRLLTLEGAFAQALIAEIRKSGLGRVVDAIAEMNGMQRRLAAWTLFQAIGGEGAEEVEEALERMVGGKAVEKERT